MSGSLPAQPHTEPFPTSTSPLDTQLLDIFFDRVPMGIAVFDRELRLQRCNKTWAGFFTHHLGVGPDYVRPGRTIHELIPQNEEEIAPLLGAVLSGRSVRQAAHRLAIGDAVTYWDVVMAPTFAEGEVVGFVDIVTDATDRVLAYELLERRIGAFASMAASMTVDQPLSSTLCALTETARDVTGAIACAVMVLDAGSGEIAIFESTGLPDGYRERLGESWSHGVESPSRQALLAQQLAVISDAVQLGLDNPLHAALHEDMRAAEWQDMVVVPLDSRGRNVGVMQYYYRTGKRIDDEERTFLRALADQAAVAIANADLYRSSEQDATLLERQRLARELHDSVSQALFSMTLHARTAERHLDAAGLGNDHAATQEVQRLLALTQGALAEMRALIFELRPGALDEEGLLSALQRQAVALTARTSVPIEVSGPAVRLPLDAVAEEHLYRIALEALNNSVKHAGGARVHVDVSVDDTAEVVVVRVRDDGVGFDPTVDVPGHLGQHTMRERASVLGAVLVVTSAPGAGCEVRVESPYAVVLRHPTDAASA